MANAEIVKEFEGALNPPAQTEPIVEKTTEKAPTPIEELEIAMGGKPFKLPVNTEFPVKHNGQILKTPLEKLLNSFRQQQHLEDKSKQFKADQEKFNAERGEFEVYQANRQKYGDLQKWSEENPQQWDRLHRLWQEREKLLSEGAGGTDATAGQSRELLFANEKIAQLEKRLGDWESRFETQENEKKIAADTEMVQKEIKEFSEKYPEIDMNEKDLDGYSLKARIMKYGIDNDIGKFSAAAREFLNDRLSDILVQRGRTEAVKNVQRDSQQGILARSDQPFNGQGTEVDPRKMSASELKRAAIAELERTPQ